MLMSSATTEAVVRSVEAALRAGLIPARAEKGTTFDISGFVLLAGAGRNQPPSFVHPQTSELWSVLCLFLIRADLRIIGPVEVSQWSPSKPQFLPPSRGSCRPFDSCCPNTSSKSLEPK